MKKTRYFNEVVLARRPYLRIEWCRRVLDDPVAHVVQSDGRHRYWGVIEELDGRILRVVTLQDGETVHNAFPDRSFRR